MTVQVAANQTGRKSKESVDPQKAEAVRRELDKLRVRLLDITKRNNLISFRHGKSSVRVVDADHEAIYKNLLAGEELPFTFVPEPDQGYVDELGEKPAPVSFAKELGWSTSIDLVSGQGQADNLRVLQYQDGLEATLRKIGTTAKTTREESGVNLLHLVFGYLEWRESDDSSKVSYAPLLVVPVELIIPKSKDGNRSFRLKYNDEDLTTNLSLVEKMRIDFGLQAPELEEGETPEQYYQRFAPILERKKDWKVCRHVSLALLSFAKLLMYLDLDSDRWGSHALVQHARLLELFAGDSNEGEGLASEFDIDEEEIKKAAPPLIYDADSSQHSALIDASRGKNLVIEGPPGTGKSQTITNLIAEAIATGKSVLFVAEKMAALDVVKRRLDSAGLGDFCLELHSHKANKVEMLRSLEKRMQTQFTPPTILTHKQSLLGIKRDELRKYVSLLNTPYAAIENTPFELIWQRDKLSMEVPDALLKASTVSLPDAHAWDFHALHIRKDLVSTYVAHLRRLSDAGGSVDSEASPWGWLSDTELSAVDRERLLGELTALNSAYENRISLIMDFEDTCELKFADIIANKPGFGDGEWLESIYGLPVAAHQDDQNSYIYELLPSFRSAAKCRIVHNFIDSVREYKTAIASNRTESLLDSTIPEVFVELDRRLEELGLSDYSLASLRNLLQAFSAAEAHVGKAQRAVNEISNALGVTSASITLRHIGDLVSAKQLLANAPLHLAHLRNPRFAKDGINNILARGKHESEALQTERDALKAEELVFQAEKDSIQEEKAQLAQQFIFDDKIVVREFLVMANILEQTPWYARFGKAYRSASSAYTAMCAVPLKQTRLQRVNSLKVLAQFIFRSDELLSKVEKIRAKSDEFRSKVDAFFANAEYKAWLEDHYVGLDTRWDDLITVAHWYEEIYSKLPEHREYASTVRSAILSLPAPRLRSVLGDLDGNTPEFTELEQALNLLSDLHSHVPYLKFEHQDADVNSFLGAVKEIVDVASNLVRNLGPLNFEDTTSRHQMKELFADVARTHSLRQALNTDEDVKAILNGRYDGVDTVLDPVTNTLALVRAIAHAISEAQLPPAVHRYLLSEQYLERITGLKEWGLSFAANSTAVATSHRALTEFGWRVLTDQGSTSSLSAERSKIQHCIECAEVLPVWLDAKRVERELYELGLKSMVGLCAGGVIAFDELPTSFEYLFCSSLLRRLFSEHPDLFRLSGTTQDEARSRFASLDRDVIELNRMDIAARASNRYVPNGYRGQSVKDMTDKQLVFHEISKQRNHIPIRQLMKRAGSAIQGLKPCFMMSPMSVAQFLEPGRISFDLVVMDEASQLRPEDALGAIARGTQLVVVGDPKQLPPTSYFQRAVDDEAEESDENSAVAEGESILDVAWGCYQPARRLRWHYRSQHESLIRFSNQEFYDGDLILFPSAYEKHDDLGVKYVPVENGIFENRRNPIEAGKVVAAILDHIKHHLSESLGVVTMNFEQRELIEDLLDKKLKDDSVSSTWIESGAGTPNEFFIKNLENVQGDERDVIFISVTYGHDSQGNYYQRFAGVNSKSGHRRLNVLITRSKRRTVVFSSLDPDFIRDEPGTAWGVRALKGYMRFAKSGVTAQPQISPGAEPSNEHEAAVSYVLKSHGYDVVPQVGVSGYFIDLGVRHPKKPGAWLLGVEFDGKSYHSGRSARDRDRLRQTALENQGWKIHRIWSTDWFKNRSGEIERLLNRVRTLENQ